MKILGHDLPTNLVAGEIIAPRSWALLTHRTPMVLRSMAFPDIWNPGEVKRAEDGIAEDRKRWIAQGAPALDEHPMMLGIHAFKSDNVNDCRSIGQYLYNSTRTLVIGKVALYGWVVEHERGYRAEYATIHSIDRVIAPRRWGWRRLLKLFGIDRRLERRLLKNLRETYGCSAS